MSPDYPPDYPIMGSCPPIMPRAYAPILSKLLLCPWNFRSFSPLFHIPTRLRPDSKLTPSAFLLGVLPLLCLNDHGDEERYCKQKRQHPCQLGAKHSQYKRIR